MRGVWIALAITLTAEVPVVTLLYRSQWMRMAATCVAANVVTNLWMNMVLIRWVHSYESYLLIGESAALCVEALTYVVASRQRGVTWALLASATANLASFALGNLVRYVG